MQLLPHPNKKFYNWALTHGKYYTIFLGGNPALVINDTTKMKQLFSHLSATGKPTFLPADVLFQGHYGIGNATGKDWIEQRNFAVKILKQLGGSKFLGSLIMGNKDLFLQLDRQINENKNSIVYLDRFMLQLVGNAVWGMVTGNTTDGHESEAVLLVEKLNKEVQVIIRSGVAFFPWLRYILPGWSGFTDYKNVCFKLHQFMEKLFHLRGENRKQSPHNFIKAYINESKNCQDSNSSFFGATGQKHGVNSLKMLLLAGAESTASTANFMVFYLLVHPKKQKRLQLEIDTVIGRTEHAEFHLKEKYIKKL